LALISLDFSRMKFLISFCLMIFFSVSLRAQSKEGLVWHTDLTKALEMSFKTKKPVFGFFTGSDWCGWCHKLQRDVFAKQAFMDWAKKNVVLLELDFPRGKQLPAELVSQNKNLAQQFGVQGFPTIWYFTGEKGSQKLNALGSHGYPSGAERGKEEIRFLADAEAIIHKNK
jgi:thioredoxin-related protein